MCREPCVSAIHRTRGVGPQARVFAAERGSYACAGGDTGWTWPSGRTEAVYRWVSPWKGVWRLVRESAPWWREIVVDACWFVRHRRQHRLNVTRASSRRGLTTAGGGFYARQDIVVCEEINAYTCAPFWKKLTNIRLQSKCKFEWHSGLYDLLKCWTTASHSTESYWDKH